MAIGKCYRKCNHKLSPYSQKKKKHSCMLFTDKGNVMITEQFACALAAYIVVCSCWKFEKHWHRHSDCCVTIGLVLPFWRVTADWGLWCNQPEVPWSHVSLCVYVNIHVRGTEWITRHVEWAAFSHSVRFQSWELPSVDCMVEQFKTTLHWVAWSSIPWSSTRPWFAPVFSGQMHVVILSVSGSMHLSPLISNLHWINLLFLSVSTPRLICCVGSRAHNMEHICS